MKAILKRLKDEPCRVHSVTENDISTFSDIQYHQRYFPALEHFENISQSAQFEKNLELPSRFQIAKWLTKKDDKIWKASVKDTYQILESTSSLNTPDKVENIFVKTVHLLDPIDLIREFYCTKQSHPLMPHSSELIDYTVDRLQTTNNQAYVDTIANFILSRFRECDLTPNGVLFYGTINGISSSYQYNVTDDYESYRNKKWFWRGIKNNNIEFNVMLDDDDMKEIEDMKEIYDEIITCPFNETELEEIDSDSDCESDEELLDISRFDLEDVQSVKSVSSLKSFNFESGSDTASASNSAACSDSESNSGDEDEEDDEADIGIYLNIKNIPVMKIFQQAQEGTMDELLDEDVIDDQLRGTQGWEARWIAWLFQVIATLSFLQSTIDFTHNDLHTNNIVWKETDKKFLYYRSKSGKVWRIPTYGKIFSIIDFGRSIFKLGRKRWISSDHFPNNDASEQYNFGPFYDKTQPKVLPNYSFDLARLSVSLLDGLFDEKPDKKKGKCNILSQEKDWIVHETKSQLFNLLWLWTIDDDGKTIYEDEFGEPRFPGFDLYSHIAHHLHSAVPKQQLEKSQFNQYIWDKKVPKNEKVYSLGC